MGSSTMELPILLALVPGKFTELFCARKMHSTFTSREAVRKCVCVSMYVCMYIYICMYVCVYIYICVYMYVYIYVCVRVCIYLWVSML